MNRPTFLPATLIACAVLALSACAANPQPSKESTSMNQPKQQVVALLKSIETGEPGPVAAINPDKYIQHNLAAADGLAGFGTLMAQLPKGSARAHTVRAFQDGDYVFSHTEYNFFGPKIGFDIFRFENGRIVEHWDNLQETSGPAKIEGPANATDLDKTDANKSVVRAHVERTGRHLHKLLGKGNFVLAVSEGDGRSFYDLFRVENGEVAEQWNTVEIIPPRAGWKNANGKFGF